MSLDKSLVCLSTKYGGWRTMDYGYCVADRWMWFDDEDEMLLTAVEAKEKP